MTQTFVPMPQAQEQRTLREPWGDRYGDGLSRCADANVEVIPPVMPRAKRLGLLEGKFTVPDDFDEPLPPDLLVAFGYEQ